MPHTPPQIVTLTTDFGEGSSYVAEMKGRLLHARAAITIVDIAHDVPAHDIRAAAWLVGQACPAFPHGAIHIVVVDPGVGTTRRMVWVRAGGHEYLAPDNGVLSRVVASSPAEAIRELVIPGNASTTFHGRDVLAPAAAAIAGGTEPRTHSHSTNGLVNFPIPFPQETPEGLAGEVVHVDSFGNLLTNLPADLLPRLVTAGRLILGDREVTRFVRTYGEAQPGTPVALVGSHGIIEVAVVQGRANDALAARVGTSVILP